MIKSVDDYKKEIIRHLKANRTYSKGLDIQITSLASAMRNLDLANKEIDGLETTTVYETTRYGEKLAPHPVFKVAKEAQELITRQMKALGLTTADLMGGDEEDPLVDITSDMKKTAKKSATIIRPVGHDRGGKETADNSEA